MKKIIITEEQLKLVIQERLDMKKVAWYNPSFLYAIRQHIPLTPKIVKALYEDNYKRINAFHMTDIGKINNFKSIVGTKKTISTFTNIDDFSLKSGIQTSGDLILQVTGDLVLNSNYDIMSMPDESGRRWIDSGSLYNIQNREKTIAWEDLINEKWGNAINIIKKTLTDYKYEKITKIPEQVVGKINEYMKWYIPEAENFFIENIEYLKNSLNEKGNSDWNEILLKNIQIKDAIIKEYNVETNYQPENRKTVSDIKNELKKLTNGNIFMAKTEDDVVNFILKRGGTVTHEIEEPITEAKSIKENKIIVYHGSNYDIQQFSNEFVGGEQAVDHMGPGIYTSDNKMEDAARYGKYTYTLSLHPNKLLSDKTKRGITKQDVIKLIKMKPDWQLNAQDWNENVYRGLMESVNTIMEQDSAKDIITQVYIDYYFHQPKLFVQNATKIGVDGIIHTNIWGGGGQSTHYIIYNPNIITIEKKELTENLSL